MVLKSWLHGSVHPVFVLTLLCTESESYYMVFILSTEPIVFRRSTREQGGQDTTFHLYAD